jgi:hypothetical protein
MARGRAHLQQPSQLRGLDHSGFIDDGHGTPVQVELIIVGEVKRFGHSQTAVTSRDL